MSGLFAEMKRRNVVRVGVAYVVVAWLLMQFADLVLENINAPDWCHAGHHAGPGNWLSADLAVCLGI